MARLRVFFMAAAIVPLACGEDEPPPRPLPEVPPGDTLFVTVEAGSYVSASGDTVEVEAFRLSRYEVTNRLYLSLAREEGLPPPPDPGFHGLEDYLWSRPQSPVVNVSAREAAKAAGAAGCRLPTAEELAYASTFPSDPAAPYPWGELEPADAGGMVNYLAGGDWDTRGEDGYPWPAPRGSFPLSDRGFADITGNVAEWTSTADSTHALVHGGSWLSPGDEVAARSFQRLFPSDRAWHTGFRLARDL
jgi:formylglycine-generating enzyme required for sulfatase activity